MASPQYSFLSSSGVKELATFGGRIDDLVPDEVAQALAGRAEALTNWDVRLDVELRDRGSGCPRR